MKKQDEKIPFLKLEKVTKVFGHTIALNEMDFEIFPGEIVGLVGSNGAGKSTLMKVITGVYEPTSGRIFNEGRPIDIRQYNATQAKSIGIACAYQELSLCSNLSPYENLALCHDDHSPFGKRGWRNRAARFTKEKLDEIFPDNGVNVKAAVSSLKLSQRQMVEITKASSTEGLKLLILDEPTSSLTGDRIEQLHAYMKKLNEQGVAIIYISHKLDEIKRICDRVTVMKEGVNILTEQIGDISQHILVEAMGGKTEAGNAEHRDCSNQPVVLDIQGLNTDNLHNINLQVHQGEIIGVSGLAGSGQKELLLEVFHAQKKKNRTIKMNTRASFVSGDRNKEGIFPLWDIADNILISSYEQVAERGVLKGHKINQLAKIWYDKLRFRASGINDDITGLSGGNQQKAIVARGIAANAGIIILNDSTCGVDIGAKQEIYSLLEEARNGGKTVIWHSTEDREMEQCDRVIVMHEGRIVEELKGDDISVQNIVATSFENVQKSNEEKQKTRDTTREEAKEGLFSRILHNRATLPIITMLLIFLINAVMNPRIASYRGIDMLYSSAVPLVFIALGQMFMVITGGIDMGNGIAVGLTNVIFAFIMATNPMQGLVAELLFIAAYAGMGALIYINRMPGIVVTLGASYIWKGIGLMIASNPGGAEVGWIGAVFGIKCPVIPTPIVITSLAALICWYVVRKSKYGMIICGNGNNPAAIERAGWSRLRAVIVTYAISGTLVVVAGMALNHISKGADINSTASYQMLSIATIILGGCEFTGGIASPVGVAAAALAISSISTLLTMLNVDSNMQSAVTGLILIGALAMKLLMLLGRRHQHE